MSARPFYCGRTQPTRAIVNVLKQGGRSLANAAQPAPTTIG